MISSRLKYVLDNDQVMMEILTDTSFIKFKHVIKAVVYDYVNFPLKCKAKDMYYIHDNEGGIWRI